MYNDLIQKFENGFKSMFQNQLTKEIEMYKDSKDQAVLEFLDLVQRISFQPDVFVIDHKDTDLGFNEDEIVVYCHLDRYVFEYIVQEARDKRFRVADCFEDGFYYDAEFKCKYKGKTVNVCLEEQARLSVSFGDENEETNVKCFLSHIKGKIAYGRNGKILL